MDAFLGLDLGTSALKALLVAEDGTRVAASSRPLALHAEEPLEAEQDAEAWWRAARAAIRDVLRAAGRTGPRVKLRAVGLTGQKHALLALDAAGAPLSRAVLWADGRATREAETALRAYPDLPRRTGAAPLPGFLVPKWQRWRRRDAAIARRTAHLLFAKDYLRWRLTGALATDPTEATASRLVDLSRDGFPFRWSPALAARFRIPLRVLPPIVGCTDVSGGVSSEASRATGLPPGLPVVGGAGDNEAGALGCGALGRGAVAVILGTSGTVVAAASRRGSPGGLVWGAHVIPRTWAATGTVLSAGRALEWIRKAAFPPGTPTAAVLAEAEAAPPIGSLVFLPSLVGERSPVPDPRGAGAFLGLRPSHGRGHLARAVVEGVAIAVGGVVDLLRRNGAAVEALHLTSGGAASPFWRMLVAAAARAPVRPSGGEDGPALGAALLAAAGIRGRESLRTLASQWVALGGREAPPAEEIARLRRLQRTSHRAATALRGVG